MDAQVGPRLLSVAVEVDMAARTGRTCAGTGRSRNEDDGARRRPLPLTAADLDANPLAAGRIGRGDRRVSGGQLRDAQGVDRAHRLDPRPPELYAMPASNAGERISHRHRALVDVHEVLGGQPGHSRVRIQAELSRPLV